MISTYASAIWIFYLADNIFDNCTALVLFGDRSKKLLFFLALGMTGKEWSWNKHVGRLSSEAFLFPGSKPALHRITCIQAGSLLTDEWWHIYLVALSQSQTGLERLFCLVEVWGTVVSCRLLVPLTYSRCVCVCGNQHTILVLLLLGASGLVNLRVILCVCVCVCVCGWLTRSSMSPCAADTTQECFLFHQQQDRGFILFLSLFVSLSVLSFSLHVNSQRRGGQRW